MDRIEMIVQEAAQEVTRGVKRVRDGIRQLELLESFFREPSPAAWKKLSSVHQWQKATLLALFTSKLKNESLPAALTETEWKQRQEVQEFHTDRDVCLVRVLSLLTEADFAKHYLKHTKTNREVLRLSYHHF